MGRSIYPKYLKVDETFGRLTVLEPDQQSSLKFPNKPSKWKYCCRCKCGAEVSVRKDALVSGITKSCGCLQKEISSNVNSKINRIEKYDNYVKIFFYNCNDFTIIDACHYGKVKDFCWTKKERKDNKVSYAVARDGSKQLLLHRVVTECDDPLFLVDHKNGNGLDNRISNLRICDNSGNAKNRNNLGSNNTSGATGVSKKNGKWEVQVYKDGKYNHIGSFSDWIDALSARINAEREEYSDFAPRIPFNPIVIISGFSSAGKDTLARKLEKEGFNFVVSSTTRPKRNYEVDGRDYNFISKDMFLRKLSKSEFIEHRKYDTIVGNNKSTWYYGVPTTSISNNKPNVVVLDVVGMREFKKKYGRNCLVLFLDVSEDLRKERCILRGDYDEFEFARRLADDLEKFPQKVMDKEVHYILKSANTEGNLEEVLKIYNKYKEMLGDS
jgi:guanylate kinase